MEPTDLHPLAVTTDYTPYNFTECPTLDKLRKNTRDKYPKIIDIIQPFVVDDHLPRAVINIKDEDIQSLSQQYNPDYYANPHLPKTPYNQTINNIPISAIPCPCQTGKQKPLFEKILGTEDPTIDALAWGNCKHTIYSAARRQLKCAPTPNKDEVQEFIQFSTSFIDKYIGDHLTHFKYSFADWLNHLPKKKQIPMKQAYDYINGLPTELTPMQIKNLLKMRYQGICKIEIQPTDGKTRMVCAIPDLVKLVMGPITWQLEEICAKYFPGYCGGKNLTEMEDEINQHIDQGFTKVVEGDGSAFDNTQDVQLKEIDRYIYRRIADHVYHVPKDLFMAISQSIYKGMDIGYYGEDKKFHTMITYYILGTVFSGDADTTLCNTIRMALYNHYTNYKIGYKIDEHYTLFSKGDDFSVLYRSNIPDLNIQQAYDITFLPKPPDETQKDLRQHGLGQICKFLDIGDPSTFKFCSLRSWYKDNQHIILTRDPAKLFTLAKYSRKSKCMNNTQLAQYLIEQAIALETSYKGIIIFDTMARIYRQRAASLRPDKAKQIITRTGDSREHYENDLLGILPQKTIENIFDVGHREHQYKIYDDYWESIKQYERVRTRLNTQEELDVINAQIYSEFDYTELEALLPVNKIYT